MTFVYSTPRIDKHSFKEWYEALFTHHGCTENMIRLYQLQLLHLVFDSLVSGSKGITNGSISRVLSDSEFLRTLIEKGDMEVQSMNSENLLNSTFAGYRLLAKNQLIEYLADANAPEIAAYLPQEMSYA